MTLKHSDSHSPGKIFLLLWFVFATVYFFWSVYHHLNNFVAANAYQKGMDNGLRTAVTQIMDQASQCKSIPLTVDSRVVNVTGVDCLSQETSGREVGE